MSYLTWLAPHMTLTYLDMWGLHSSPGLGSRTVRVGSNRARSAPPMQDVRMPPSPPQSHWGWMGVQENPLAREAPASWEDRPSPQ